jgi:hypothetical protein
MQRLLFSAFLAFALLCSKANAEILLTIDISNPANVTFSATNGHPDADFDLDASIGFTLLGFLTNDEATSFDSTGTLSASGMIEPYLSLFTLDYAGGLYEPGRDLNLYANADAGTQNFLTTAPAFSGSITFDLSEIASLFPSVGTTGTIQAGDGSTVGPVIGSYEVVPEPAACILVGAAGMLLIFRRRRSH